MADSGQELIDVLDPGLQRLQSDAASLRTVMRRLGKNGHPPPAAHRDISRAHHDALSLHAAIHAVNTSHPAKDPLLKSLTQLAKGLSLLNRALRQKRAAKAHRFTRRSRRFMSRSSHNFLKADQALGCHYGCTAPPK